MTDAKTREHRDKEWWDAWWSEDFSWDGLGALNPDGAPKHPWEGWVVDTGDGSIHEADKAPDARIVRPATLQDYWREQESDLITGPDGVRFTRVHLPPAWEDGTPTDKVNWPDDALDAILAPKLLAGETTLVTGERHSEKVEGQDRRAQLQGSALLRAATHPEGNASPISARFARAAFLRDAWFSSATFSGDASFNSATFSGDVFFDSATFSGEAIFDSATFPATASFRSATFSGNANFESATFSGEAIFDSATFPATASFRSATFSGSVAFENATFSSAASFQSATFSGVAIFSSATFSVAIFSSATFSGDANFNYATFSSDAGFQSATFSGDANFESATFSGDVFFASATFSSDAGFDSVTFSGVAIFRSATFSGNADFESATFSGVAIFEDAKFRGATRFVAAVFDKPVSFERIVWPGAPQDWHSALYQTVFKSAPVFTGAGFKSLAAFDGAVLERGVDIDDPPAKASDRVFQSERRDAIKAVRADLVAWVEEQEQEQKGESNEVEGEADTKKPKRISGRERKKQLEEFRNRRLAELEGGCRTLKKAMEYASNKTREQLFYRYELIARRAQSATPLSEKIFSYLYDWFGNYGASIGRPFMAVTGLTLLFAGVYWGLDIGWVDAASHAVALNPTANVDPALERALSFSASRIFPFGAFDDVSAGWLQSYETAHGSLAALGVRILASLQSTFALTLVFMVGLAVRRKFQIS